MLSCYLFTTASQRRIRDLRTCHHQTIHIRQNAPHLKKSINQADLGSGTFERIVTHLEVEIELNGLETPDELQINTLSHKTATTHVDITKPTCHHHKSKKNKLKTHKVTLSMKRVAPISLSQTTMQTITRTTTKIVTELKENQNCLPTP